MIEECFGARVIDAYTMTEFGLIATECRAGNKHIDTTSVYVEVVDDDDHPVGDGESGELVITSVSNSATPLLRYKTGDLGAVSNKRCPCGGGGPLITGLSGKKIIGFRLPDGSTFAPTFFNDLFTRFPVLGEFQITQKTGSRYDVTVELRPDVEMGASSEEIEKVRAYVESSLPGAPLVGIEVATFPRDGKFQRYRSEA
jgi:phenylacetate-CoA ligase